MDNADRQADQEGLAADTGMTADLGVAQPGSPADEMGTSIPPTSGGVGALDVDAGGDLTGDDQEHERGIVDEETMPLGDALKPRITEDIAPNRSNISGPTPTEEGRNR